MTKAHILLLSVSVLIVFLELSGLIYYYQPVVDWVSGNLWIVIVPFIKVLVKKIIALKLAVFFKAIGVLIFHFSKLIMLKFLKLLTVRYGVFFSQRKWRRIRKLKLIFLRKGKAAFYYLSRFWQIYSPFQKVFVWLAFFPVVLLLYFFGFSFNMTRQTMVDKMKEKAIFENESKSSSKGFRAWVLRLDSTVLKKIKELTLD